MTEPLYDFERPEMLDYVPRGAGAVLDVGCSTGRFGVALRDRDGRTVVGIEPDPGIAELARGRLADVVTGLFPDVEDAVRRAGGYDVIVFNDVLEHMVDPAAALDAAASLLAPGGVVVASIPNVRHITAVGPLVVRDSWHYTDIGVLDRTHLRFFTRTSIRQFFDSAGWQIERLDGINRCRRPGSPDSRPLRAMSRVSGGRTDPFFFLQYAVVARPN